MTREYTHELNREIRSIAGGYELEKEGRIEIKGAKILYAVGNAIADSSCCGSWGCRYALVPGYVRRLNIRQDDRGFWVSEVEPILDHESRTAVTSLLKQKERVSQVRFL